MESKKNSSRRVALLGGVSGPIFLIRFDYYKSLSNYVQENIISRSETFLEYADILSPTLAVSFSYIVAAGMIYSACKIEEKVSIRNNLLLL
jgi:hypothetical protein